MIYDLPQTKKNKKNMNCTLLYIKAGVSIYRISNYAAGSRGMVWYPTTSPCKSKQEAAP